MGAMRARFKRLLVFAPGSPLRTPAALPKRIWAAWEDWRISEGTHRESSRGANPLDLPWKSNLENALWEAVYQGASLEEVLMIVDAFMDEVRLFILGSPSD
jgi:hypothetical protein